MTEHDTPPVDVYGTPPAIDTFQPRRAEVEVAHMPPSDTEMEEALIGALLYNGGPTIRKVLDTGLAAQHFYRLEHRALFEAIAAVHERTGDADVLTVAAQLRSMKVTGHDGKKQVVALGFVGGERAVVTVGDRHIVGALAPSYAEGVIELARRRKLLENAHEVARLAYDAENAADEVQRAAETMLLETGKAAGAKHQHGERHESHDSVEAWAALYSRLEDRDTFERETVSWGRPELDERLGRMEKGAVFVPAGWTKHGKTWWCLDVAEAVCEQGHRVLIASGEMSDTELVERWVAMGGHDYTAVQEKTTPWQKLRDRVERIRKWARTTITGKLTVARIRSEVVRAHLEGKPYRVVVLDHLGLLRPDRGAKFQPRREFVEDAVAELKAMAEEFGFTLLLVAQLSRPEKDPKAHPRWKRAPFEGDLKEASGIEQIATAVIFVYRIMDRATGKFGVMDPDTAQVVNDGQSELLFPFHRSRPTPKALSATFTTPRMAASDGAYRFVPSGAHTPAATPAAPPEPVQQSLEDTFGPDVTVVHAPDDDGIPF